MPEGILQATAGGSNTQLNDDTGDHTIFAVHSSFIYAPQRTRMHQNSDLTHSFVGDPSGLAGKTLTALRTAWTLPDMTDMFPLEVLQVGGNYLNQSVNRVFHRTLNTLELAAGVAMGLRSPIYDLWVDTSAVLAIGAGLTICGPRVAGFAGGADAALSTLSPLPLFNVRATDVNFLFDTSWTVSGPALNVAFTLSTFTLTATAAVNILVGTTTVTIVDGNVTIVTPSLNIEAPAVNITGLVTVAGDVIANGVSLTTHIHAGVQSGPEVTGPPFL